MIDSGMADPGMFGYPDRVLVQVGGAKRITKDDKVVMAKNRLDQYRCLVRVQTTVDDNLLGESKEVVDAIYDGKEPFFIENLVNKLSVSDCNEVLDLSVFTGNDSDANIGRIAPVFMPNITKIDAIMNNLNNHKTSLVKSFIIQFTREFYDEDKKGFSYKTFKDSVETRLDLAKEEVVSAKLKGEADRHKAFMELAFHVELVRREEAMRVVMRSEMEAEIATRLAAASSDVQMGV